MNSRTWACHVSGIALAEHCSRAERIPAREIKAAVYRLWLRSFGQTRNWKLSSHPRDVVLDVGHLHSSRARRPPSTSAGNPLVDDLQRPAWKDVSCVCASSALVHLQGMQASVAFDSRFSRMDPFTPSLMLTVAQLENSFL